MRFTDIYMLVCEDKLTDELAKSSLSQEQKERIKEINAKLSNRTKYISWLIKNVSNLPGDIVELLNWFQARVDLKDRNIVNYSLDELRSLYDDKSGTISQTRKKIEAVGDEEGAGVVYQDGPITVWKIKKAEWLRKNFTHTNWCVAGSGFKKSYEDLTTKDKLTLYVIHDGSRERYSQFTGKGDVWSDICLGVDTSGTIAWNARQTADNNDVGEAVARAHIEELGIPLSVLGLDDAAGRNREIIKKAVEKAGGVRLLDGKRVLSHLDLSWSDITSLVGLEVDHIINHLDCSRCGSLSSLSGSPASVGGDFSCECCFGLTSLSSSPTSVGGDFFCGGCHGLKSLEWAPAKVDGSFHCDGCGIKFTETEVRSRCEVGKDVHT